MMLSEGSAGFRAGRRHALKPAFAGAWGPRHPGPSGKAAGRLERIA